MGDKEDDRLIDRHRQHIANRSAPKQNVEGFPVEAAPAAAVAQDLHIGQKVHFDALYARAITRRTTPVASIE